MDRCEQCIIDNDEENTNNMLITRCQTLQEVINDLNGRLNENVM